MPEETIRVGNFDWTYEDSSLLDGGRNPGSRYVSGYRGMDAHCPCGAKWHADIAADLDYGNFIRTGGAFVIKCPHCGREDALPSPELP